MTSLFAVLPILSARSYSRDLYKKRPSTYEPVNVDITHSITENVQYSIVYIYKGAMHVLYGGGVPAAVTFTIHVSRADTNTAVPALATLVALQRYNLTDFTSTTIPTLLNSGTLEYPNETLVLLPPGGGTTVTLQWYEDGVSITLPANVTWQPGAFAALAPGSGASDSNTADKTIDANFNTTAFTTTAKGTYYAQRADINGDGLVDQLDAISLTAAFGKTGPPGWIPADVMPDGVVDYFDALMVERMFNWKITSSSFQPGPVSWNLKISTPPGRSQNDTVVVYSDYIVYSNYSYNRASAQLTFNIASDMDGFCNVTIPETSMSGPFTVYLDDTPTPCIVTGNVVYFNSTGLSQQVRIVGTRVQVHDVAATGVSPYSSQVYQGRTLSINASVANPGDYTEAFNVTLYANTTPIASQNVTLSSGDSTTVTFPWNTTALAIGNYTVSAYAEPVQDDINTANNNFTGRMVYVAIPGDINGDGTVDILDAIIQSNSFLATPGSSNWNPNADINGDGVVDILDAIILSNHFGQHYP